jgi:ribosomal-protein-serine acetyltransferase
MKDLQAEDLTLELLAPRHVPELFALTDRNRAHLGKWLPWVEGNTYESDTRNFVHSMADQRGKGIAVAWGILRNGQLTGIIDFHGMELAQGKAQIGYWLGAEFTGKGIITRACKAVVTYGIAELGLREIRILCLRDNEKSKAVPRRLGFEELPGVAGQLYLNGENRELEGFVLMVS